MTRSHCSERSCRNGDIMKDRWDVYNAKWLADTPLLATIKVSPCLRAGHSELRAAFFHNLDSTKLILRRPMI